MSKINQIRRSMNALQRLRSDTKNMVPMEMYKGMGNVVVRTYTALHQAVSTLVEDSFIAALHIDLPEDASDRQKVTQVNLLSGQLLVYVEELYEEMKAESEIQEKSLTDEERTRRRFNDMMDNS